MDNFNNIYIINNVILIKILIYKLFMYFMEAELLPKYP